MYAYLCSSIRALVGCLVQLQKMMGLKHAPAANLVAEKTRASLLQCLKLVDLQLHCRSPSLKGFLPLRKLLSGIQLLANWPMYDMLLVIVTWRVCHNTKLVLCHPNCIPHSQYSPRSQSNNKAPTIANILTTGY